MFLNCLTGGDTIICAICIVSLIEFIMYYMISDTCSEKEIKCIGMLLIMAWVCNYIKMQLYITVNSDGPNALIH